jgi:hypothetical protein
MKIRQRRLLRKQHVHKEDLFQSCLPRDCHRFRILRKRYDDIRTEDGTFDDGAIDRPFLTLLVAVGCCPFASCSSLELANTLWITTPLFDA